MDNELARGLEVLGLELPESSRRGLLRYAAELLKWNQKVNLTAITDPTEVVDKHLLDSLAVVPEIGASRTLLDLGAGAGLPGLPLALALPSLEVTLVDAVAKKVGFMKHAIATLGLAGRVRALHVRVQGQPQHEGLSPAEVVISRALTEVEAWRALARPYTAAGGKVVAMLGRSDDALARRYSLPLSGDPRAVRVFPADDV